MSGIILNLYYYKNLSKINLIVQSTSDCNFWIFTEGNIFKWYKQKDLLYSFTHLILLGCMLYTFMLLKTMYNHIWKKSNLTKANPIPHREAGDNITCVKRQIQSFNFLLPFYRKYLLCEKYWSGLRTHSANHL